MTLAQSPPAGGAPVLQIVLAAAASLLVFVPLAVVVLRERDGRATLVGRVADRAASITDLPRWLALPMLVQGVSFASAGLGVYWDVPWHMDLGRDEGPLANPAHYFILAGLLGIFAAGVLSVALADGELPRGAVRIGRGWRVPAGSLVLLLAGMVALSGFPLDDVWHRLFGQDVTEWGPTHVLMIGGAVVSLLGTMLLIEEARQVRGRTRGVRRARVHFAALWLLGVSAFLMEFEVGVPQYPMVSHVVLLTVAATWALVYARLAFGPGGALVAVAIYLAARMVLWVLTGAVLDRTPAQFSLYVVPALVVELLPVVLPTARRYAFGVVAGVLVGTVGLLAEAAWTHVVMPMPWPAALWPRFLAYGVLAGIGAGLVVGWQLSRLDGVRHDGTTRGHRLGLAGAVLVVVAMVLAVPRADDERFSARLTLTDAGDGTAYVTAAMSEPVPAHVWFTVLAWQGGGRVLAPMEHVGGTEWRSRGPVPVDGSWKTVLRLHLPDDYLVATPVYQPADPAIPAEEVPAVSGVTRSFGSEHLLLQREARRGLPGWLWATGYGTTFVTYALVFAAIAWLYTTASLPGRRTQPTTPLPSSDPARH